MLEPLAPELPPADCAPPEALPLDEDEDDGIPGMDEPPLAPPAEGCPPERPPELLELPPELLEEPPPAEPPLEPDEPPLEELGEEGMEEEEDCWPAQPPIRKLEIEPTITQCTATVSSRRDDGDSDIPAMGNRVD